VKAEGLRGDIEAARSQIVASPARLRGEVEHTGRLVEDARTALAAAHAETAALQRRREVVAKATKDVGKCLSLMGEVDGEVRKLKAVSKEVKGKGAAREERAAEAAELQEQVARMERRVRAAEEKLEEAKRRYGGCGAAAVAAAAAGWATTPGGCALGWRERGRKEWRAEPVLLPTPVAARTSHTAALPATALTDRSVVLQRVREAGGHAAREPGAAGGAAERDRRA
jgi:hypothetical protein